MSKLRVSGRVALAVCVIALPLLAAAASAAGYLVETHQQQNDRDHRLAAAAAYVQHGKAQAETTQWQHALTGKLAALGLGASLTLAGPPDGKRLLYNQSYQDAHKQPAATQPTATYVFPLARGSDQTLRLTLYALPFDRNRRLLVALASGLTALLAGVVLLVWAAGRWLIAPLQRLNTQVDAIAGGDLIDTRATSPLREVDNVAAAVAGMATRLAQTAEQDARLEAEQRLLVSSIAHDLRTPLFSLRGYLDAIATGIGNPNERLDRAREKAGQIDRLVTSLFDYARADIDAHPRLQTTDLAEAVTDTTAAFELAAHERGVELRVTAHTSPQVTIDRDGFERALTNVLDNALRHTPRGSAIDITCGEDTDGAYVQVADDGPGIPPDLLPHIFEPLVRANNSRNGHTGGTGLGLTIAARLLQNHGGTIHAANTPRHGAILTLRLPRTAAPGNRR
jgi:signal transduction histidine kinase